MPQGFEQHERAKMLTNPETNSPPLVREAAFYTVAGAAETLRDGFTTELETLTEIGTLPNAKRTILAMMGMNTRNSPQTLIQIAREAIDNTKKQVGIGLEIQFYLAEKSPWSASPSLTGYIANSLKFPFRNMSEAAFNFKSTLAYLQNRAMLRGLGIHLDDLYLAELDFVETENLPLTKSPEFGALALKNALNFIHNAQCPLDSFDIHIERQTQQRKDLPQHDLRALLLLGDSVEIKRGRAILPTITRIDARGLIDKPEDNDREKRTTEYRIAGDIPVDQALSYYWAAVGLEMAIAPKSVQINKELHYWATHLSPLSDSDITLALNDIRAGLTETVTSSIALEDRMARIESRLRQQNAKIRIVGEQPIANRLKTVQQWVTA